jgi:hypothetical protein
MAAFGRVDRVAVPTDHHESSPPLGDVVDDSEAWGFYGWSLSAADEVG